jgi:hypothetical protein
MTDFIGRQLEKIIELFEEEQSMPQNEKVNSILYIAGNLLFVIASFILVWKGCFFLYEYLFPSTSFKTTDVVVRTGMQQLLKSPWMILFLIAAFLFVVRLIVALKVYIKPFYILSFIGIAVLIKKLWVIAFTNDYETYRDFLADFVKDIFK